MSTQHIILYVVIAFWVILTQSLSAQQTPLAATPPMGWNSWNRYACDVSDALIRKQADAMVNSGLKAAGYQYVDVDDCWEGQRDANGYIQPNERFPDMKALGDYIHSKGLKFGIYSSPGPRPVLNTKAVMVMSSKTPGAMQTGASTT
jgi:alpha-galactosidase